jgi:DNA-binding response OmpR family regulator
MRYEMAQNEEQILIVEDDEIFADGLKDYLIYQGFSVSIASHGIEMKSALEAQSFDLIILDIGLPGEDGLSLVRWLHTHKKNLPIIIASASGEDIDRIVGLEIGADDYLPKPFNMREMLARIRAVLRRYQLLSESQMPVSKKEIYTFGSFELNTAAHLLSKEGKEISLTSAEFELLAIFVTHPNRVMSRTQLMEMMKGYNYEVYDRSIDVRISRIRHKIETNHTKPCYIRTIRNEGYLFSPTG